MVAVDPFSRRRHVSFGLGGSRLLGRIPDMRLRVFVLWIRTLRRRRQF